MNRRGVGRRAALRRAAGAALAGVAGPGMWALAPRASAAGIGPGGALDAAATARPGTRPDGSPEAWPEIRPDTAARIEALIARMTPEEKAGQLTLVADEFRIAPHHPINPQAQRREGESLEARIRAGELTGVFNGVGAAGGRRLQQAAVEGSRLGIPLLFAADVIHGLYTVFPIPLAEAASFDPALAERTARAAAVEAAACGIHWTFAPMVDVGRDQRWGRVCEGTGEDVLLSRLFAAARVRGFQSRRLSDPDALLACPKHFAGYGAVGGGMEYNSAEIGEADLRDVHLPPFRAAFDAGALSTMSAFHDIDGIPATADRALLTGVLRDEWRFRGLVVSDYTADTELVAHGVAADERDAARIALLAGVDVSLQSGAYLRHLPSLLAAGEVPVARVDEAVRRVLRVKAALGLFDDPYRSLDPAVEAAQVRTPAARALAREAARRSIVLLKNDGGVLPLPRRGRRVALIGPFGADTANLHGPWTPFADPRRGVSLAEGLRDALDDPALLTVEAGCDVDAPRPGGIARAVAAARRADVVLLAIGESADMSGESQSRTQIVVPAAQQALAEAVAAALARSGRPVVVLLRNGRALALQGAVRDAAAIVVTWFLGEQTGGAVADVLFGAVEPVGRLPVSFPLDPGQQPWHYAHRPTGRPQPAGALREYTARYRELPNEALYPFGHGLGYTRFELHDLRFGPREAGDQPPADPRTPGQGHGDARLPWDGALEFSVELRNIGERDGEERVQLYLRPRVASRAQPVRLLKAFQAVALAAGQRTRVAFRLTRADLAYTAALGPGPEPGEYLLWVGTSSVGGLPAVFRLEAATR